MYWNDWLGWSLVSWFRWFKVIKVIQVIQVILVVQVVQVVQVVTLARTTSLDDMHSENIWFSWSKSSNYRGKLRCHACDGRTNGGRRKVENRAVFCWTRNRNNTILIGDLYHEAKLSVRPHTVPRRLHWQIANNILFDKIGKAVEPSLNAIGYYGVA